MEARYTKSGHYLGSSNIILKGHGIGEITASFSRYAHLLSGGSFLQNMHLRPAGQKPAAISPAAPLTTTLRGRGATAR